MAKHKLTVSLIDKHMKYAEVPQIGEFCRYVQEGMEPFLAAMHATRSYPGVVGTDTQYLSGSENQFAKCPMLGEWLKKTKPGYSRGAVFHQGLGEWIHTKGDLERHARRKNKTFETDTGKILAQGEYTPIERPPLSPQIIRDNIIMEAMKDPGSVDSPDKVRRMKEDIINTRTPHWRKGKKIIE